tara:strand:- start:1868 stop:2659 length:792 start_codon:yes stop_codon:yes gene_type:complete
MLIDVDSLDLLLERNVSGIVVLDARPAEDFLAGRVLGARNVDVSSQRPIIRSERDLTGFNEILLEIFRTAGVDRNSKVIVYDDGSGTAAARGAWMLHYLGHLDVQVLDGGFAEWGKCNKVVEDGPDRNIYAMGNINILSSRDCMANADDIVAGEHIVLDVRSNEEFNGVNMRGNPRGGHIPGAIRMGHEVLVDDAGKYRSPDDIKSTLIEHGIGHSSSVVVYCQSGARSSHTYIGLHIAGVRRIRNYIGSWYEWSRRDDLPLG